MDIVHIFTYKRVASMAVIIWPFLLLLFGVVAIAFLFFPLITDSQINLSLWICVWLIFISYFTVLNVFKQRTISMFTFACFYFVVIQFVS